MKAREPKPDIAVGHRVLSNVLHHAELYAELMAYGALTEAKKADSYERQTKPWEAIGMSRASAVMTCCGCW
jgi:hypothetical protein